MAVVNRAFQSESQKEIVKLFEKLSGKYSIHGLWNDFIVMTACKISNTVDLVNREEREKILQTISEKYGENEKKVFEEIMDAIVSSLEINPSQDLLGELYMDLGISNKSTGQFFTPYGICLAMAECNTVDIEKKIEEKGWIAVNDPAAGAGATMIAFANVCLERKINYQRKCLFVCQEIDFSTACMCYIQLSLLGCAGYIYVGNTLTDPCCSIDGRGLIPKKTENTWFTPMYFMEPWVSRIQFEGLRLIMEGMTGRMK